MVDLIISQKWQTILVATLSPLILILILPLESISPDVVIVGAGYYLLLLNLWNYGVGEFVIRQQEKLEKRFGILFRFNVAYLFVYNLALVTIFTVGKAFVVGQLTALTGFIFLASHIYAIYAIFYSIFFVARAVRGIELGRKARLSDWFGLFLMLWIFPITLGMVHRRTQSTLEQRLISK